MYKMTLSQLNLLDFRLRRVETKLAPKHQTTRFLPLKAIVQFAFSHTCTVTCTFRSLPLIILLRFIQVMAMIIPIAILVLILYYLSC